MAIMELISTIMPLAMEAMQDKGAEKKPPMTFNDIDPISTQTNQKAANLFQQTPPAMPGGLPSNRAEGGGFGLGIGAPENRGPGDTFTAAPGGKSKLQEATEGASKKGENVAKEMMGGWDKAAIAASVASGLLNQGGGPALPNVGFTPGGPVSNNFMV